MPKKFLNKIIESAFGNSSKSEGGNTKKTDLRIVSDAIQSVQTWDQLATTKKLIINFIKKHKVKSESPEYKYVLRLYHLRKIVLKSHRIDEGDDDIERLRSVIKEETNELDWMGKTSDIELKVGNEFYVNDRVSTLKAGESFIVMKVDEQVNSVTLWVNGDEVVHYGKSTIEDQIPSKLIPMGYRPKGLPKEQYSRYRGYFMESLNWEDKDENWDTDNSYWGNDPNWVQGDAGGSSDSDSDSGDYDSFMGEDDDLGWMDEISEFTLEWPWAIINDNEDGEGIVKFLLSIGYVWTSFDDKVKFTNKDAYTNLNDYHSDEMVFGYFDFDGWNNADTIEDEINDFRNGTNIHYWSKIKPTTSLEESTDGLEWMDDIEPTLPREDGDLRPGDVIYIGNKGNPRYILNIVDVGPVKSISDKYGEELDVNLSRNNETMAIAYEIDYMDTDDNEEESRGDVTIMGAKYAKHLIVKRDYWKYLSKVG